MRNALRHLRAAPSSEDRIRELEAELRGANAQLARRDQEIERLLDQIEQLRHLAVADTVEAAPPPASVRESLLRERETNRHLADEVHRLTMASLAAEKEAR